MLIGYASDPLGNATYRVQILSETIDGRYVVRQVSTIPGIDSKPYMIYGSLQLRNKEDIKDIQEVENERD